MIKTQQSLTSPSPSARSATQWLSDSSDQSQSDRCSQKRKKEVKRKFDQDEGGGEDED